MNKYFVLAGLSLAFASCKKDWTCTCEGTTTYNGQTSEFPKTTSTIYKSNKKDAELQCDNAGTSGEETFKASTGGQGSADLQCEVSN